MDNSAAFWWKQDERQMAADVFGYIKWLQTDQGYKQAENFKNMRLYGQSDYFNLKTYPYAQTTYDSSSSLQNRVTLNVVQSMIDTVTSKITKTKPKPTFLTDGGNFSQQRRAKKLTQFVEGQFQACDFYAKEAISFKDSCIFGTGAIKLFRIEDEIKAERIFIDELIMDDREALYGAPRQIHQRKFIHKDELKAMFPAHEQAIEMQAQSNTQSYTLSANNYNSEMILVIESWRLPSKKGATDGKHAICIENQTLLSESYTKLYFPFVFSRWNTRPLGFFGQGLAEQLTGLQLEINKILRTIQVSMHLVSVPKIFVEAGSKIVSAHLNNQIGGIVKYAGTKPEPGQIGMIPQELFAHLDRLYSRAYEIAGVSQLAATATKPAGLDSGKALRTFNDLETERFMSVAQRREETFLDAARILIDLAKEMDEEMPGGYRVKCSGKHFLETIKWKDVKLEEDTYTMHVYPVSSLSSTPAGRLADVQELIGAGFIGKEDAMRLLDFPDLQNFYNFSTAAGEDIMALIERFIDKGEYETPEPFQNLAYGIEKMQQAYLYFKAQGCDEDTLELFRRWIQDADSLVKKATTAAAKQTFEAQAATQAGAEAVAIAEGAPLEAAPLPDDGSEMGPVVEEEFIPSEPLQ